MSTRNILLAVLAVVIVIFFATGSHTAYAAGKTGNAAEAHRPGKDLHDVYEYTKQVHSYANGNSEAIKWHGKQINGLKANKVDKTEFYADQARQDKQVNAVQNAAQIANEKADAGAVRADRIEGSLAVTDNRSINNAVRLDGVEGHNVRQDASIDALNQRATSISDTLNAHGDVLSNHQAQIDALGSRMSGEVANAVSVANEAHRQAKIAQDQAVASLAVAGHSYDHSHYGLQTAISAASFGGSTALAIGFGGKVSDRVFLNGAFTNAGSATGGVVSSTIAW